MKNLKLTCNINFKAEDLGELVCCVKDTLFSIRDNVLQKFHFGDKEQILDLSTAFPNENLTPNNILYTNIPESEILIGCDHGELIRVALNSDKYSKINIETNGIQQLVISPNNELLVCLNGLNEIVLYTLSLAEINRVDLFDQSAGEIEQVNVGWGKRETQFQGSIGKSAAFKTPEKVETDRDDKIKITWRGDSLLYAISYWDIESNARKIKIFNTEGKLQCESERTLTGLESPFCWRPKNHITAVQKLFNKYVVVFIEKNGLRKNDFTLPNNIKVTDLYWNKLSTILLIVCNEIETNQQFLLIYTTGNYHWYLKQKINFDNPITNVIWDDSGAKFYVLCNQVVFCLEFMFEVNHSRFSSTADKAYVSVIDNDKLLVTSFLTCVIPPPMSQHTLECPASINQVMFAPESCTLDWFMCTVLSNNQLCFFKEDKNSLQVSKICDVPKTGKVCVWEWLSSKHMLSCESNLTNSSSLIKIYKLSEEKGLHFLYEFTTKYSIIKIIRGEKIYMQDITGNILSLSDDLNYKIEKITYHGENTNVSVINNNWFDLDNWKILSVNKIKLAQDVTSYFVCWPFIFLTSSRHVLEVYNLDQHQLISSRKIEVGATIVVVTEDSVVFQIPRGNLETIKPPVLSVKKIGLLLDQRKFNEAVTIIRKLRLKFDLCVDHNPECFLANVSQFIEQVDPNWLTIIITELSTDDTTKTLYSKYYDKDRPIFEDKVNKICSLLIETLKNKSNPKFLLPMLSCLVKIKRMPEAIAMASDETVLEHLLFLVDIDALYYEALGAYNLPIALKVAEKSRMDPKEYLPYLQSLEKLEPDYMKFKIDKALKRNDLALKNICKCPDEKMEECYNFIKETNLYSLALELFHDNKERYKTTATMFGEYLYRKHCLDEAGIMFMRAQDKETALKCFTQVGNWMQCLHLVKEMRLPEEKTKEIFKSLYNTLISKQAFREASNIALSNLDDPDKAIDALMQGKLYQNALYVSKMNDKQYDDTIKTNVIETGATFLEDLNTIQQNLSKYVTRLRIVRQEKASKPKFEDFDAMSDTSSVSSRSSQSSNSRTSRNTKKMTRKLFSLKEGNPREEEGLIAAIQEIITLSTKLAGDVKNIALSLLHFGKDLLAMAVQEKMKDLLTLINTTKKSVWPKNLNDAENAEVDHALRYPPSVNVPSWELESLK